MLALKSGRPIYGIVLLVLSSLYMAVVFLPLLYLIVFPNQDIQGVVSALQGRAAPSMDAETVVQQAMAAAGRMTSATQVGYYFGKTTAIHYVAPRRSETITIYQVTYIARFEKHPESTLIAITCYEQEEGQKSYAISGANAGGVIRGYAIPLGLFGVSLILARRKKSAASAGKRSLRPD